jgi:hypothetical protein
MKLSVVGLYSVSRNPQIPITIGTLAVTTVASLMKGSP